MASKRRGGFRPPELRGTLGTLLRTTTDVVRDALERGAREGRARLDDFRASGKRHDALAELGEMVLELIRSGEIDLEELPEARELVSQLDQLDAEEPDAQPRAASRQRWDDRAGGGEGERPKRVERAESRDDRYAEPREPREPARRPGSDSDTADDLPRRPASRAGDDGTVSSGASLRATRPTTPARPREATVAASTRAPTKPIKGIWRPDVDAPGPDDRPSSPSSSSSLPPRLAPDPHRKGGISFDDDDDLADYMHPDDVPAKTPVPAHDLADDHDPGDRDP